MSNMVGPHHPQRVFIGMDQTAPPFILRHRSLSTASVAPAHFKQGGSASSQSEQAHDFHPRRRSSVSTRLPRVLSDASWLGSHFDVAPPQAFDNLWRNPFAGASHAASANITTKTLPRTQDRCPPDEDSIHLDQTPANDDEASKSHLTPQGESRDRERRRTVHFRHSESNLRDQTRLAAMPKDAPGAELHPSNRSASDSSVSLTQSAKAANQSPMNHTASRGLLPSAVIRTDRMLVKASWVANHQVAQPYDEQASKRYDPIDDPLTEYAVCLRKGVLQLYRERHAPWRIVAPSRSGFKVLADEIMLDRARTHLSIFNPSDCTFCLTVSVGSGAMGTVDERLASRRTSSFGSTLDATREKHHKRAKILHVRHPGTTIYIFRARSVEIAGIWLAELASELGIHVPRIVPLKVQDLSATVMTPLWAPDETEWHCKSAKQVLAEAVQHLTTVRNFRDLYGDLLGPGVGVGLAWRSRMHLTWIGEDEESEDDIWSTVARTYVMQLAREAPSLEIRPALHYPTSVNIGEARVDEPAAIEGFVMRVRSGKANERIYLASQDGLLFLIRQKDALPPRPPRSPDRPVLPAGRKASIASSSLPSQRVLAGRALRAMSFSGLSAPRTAKESTPEPTPEAHIDDFHVQDLTRQRGMLKQAFAFVDVREIREVVSLLTDISADREGVTRLTTANGMTQHGQEASQSSQVATSKSRRPGFDVELVGGRRLRFGTDHPEVAQEWVTRLPELRDYWRKRWEVDVKVRMTAQMDQATDVPMSEVEQTRSRMLPSIFHHCILMDCRTLTKYGPLGKKSDAGGERWKSRFVILAGPTLQEHLVLERSKLGEIKQTGVHRQRFVMSLEDAYVFSGELCEQLLGRRGHGSSRIHERQLAKPNPQNVRSTAKLPFLRPEATEYRRQESEARARHQLKRETQHPPPRMQRSAAWDPDEAELAFRGANPKARVYTDGLRTGAGPADLCFVIWKKATAVGEDERTLGSRHTLRIYRARSKLERDEWLFAINEEISRLHNRRNPREVRLRSFQGIK